MMAQNTTRTVRAMISAGEGVMVCSRFPGHRGGGGPG
jgi:hypothetical protein